MNCRFYLTFRKPIRDILFGESEFYSKDANELTTRCYVLALFAAAPLFVLIELSPTAWTISTVTTLLVINPRVILITPPRLSSRLAVSLLLFALMACLSALWSGEPRRSFAASLKFAGFIVIGVIIVTRLKDLSSAQLERIYKAATAGAFIGLACLAIVEIETFARGRLDVYAIRSFHKTAFYGLFFAIFLLHRNGQFRLFRIAFVFLFYALPTLLFGRTSGVDLTIVLAIPLMFATCRSLRRFVVAFFLIYCALAITAPLTVDLFYSFADGSLFSTSTHVGSYMARLDLWKQLALEIKLQPWLGHGADTVRIMSLDLASMRYYDLPDIPSAHNVVFDVWYELGLVGVVALIYVFASAARVILRVRDQALFIGSVGFFGTLIELSVDHRIWLSWLQGALIAAATLLQLSSLLTTRTDGQFKLSAK